MRSFGEDKHRVALLGERYFQGMQAHGVMGVVKHFPGHGDTHTDSHKATPVINHDRDFIDSVDAYPFKYAIENNVWGVMAGHLEVGALTSQANIPSSVNADIINGYLRDELGFKGLVFTDAMNMKGLTERYGRGEAEVMAILSGVDIILMPENIDTAVNAVIQAVNNGRIPRKLIKEKCQKILRWKYDMGLMSEDRQYVLPDEGIKQKAKEINYKIYSSAITQAANNAGNNPIGIDKDSVVIISVGTSGYDTFVNALKKEKKTEFVTISSDTAFAKKDSSFFASLKGKDIYVLMSGGRFSKSSSYYGITLESLSVLKKLNDRLPQSANLILFANAYSLKYIDSSYRFKNILVAYENNTYSQQVMADMLLNNCTPEGILPVHAQKVKVFADSVGVIADNKEIKPVADTLISKKYEMMIDSVALQGIKSKAYPGCQILIAKDGKIIFDKNYGYLTYDSVLPVTDNTVYDIASVTKVMATTIAVMKLYEQGKISLDEPVSKYVPLYKDCAFGKLTIKELLSHYTVLPATYLFWTKTLKDGKLSKDIYDYDVRMDENYIAVTDSLFIKKSYLEVMKKQLKDVKLKDKQYTYSDLNFLLLQYVIENVSGQSLASFTEKYFYKSMDLHNTCFNPLQHEISRDKIAPTENDTVFRHQLIHGTVHDPMASLHGGVCGNAGLFSNTHDLFRICQMLLNKGELDGVRYLEEATVNTFNTRFFEDKNIRRALGFDKPFISSVNTHCSVYASQKSFGHSGFTGTYVWIDPQNGTVYIFLSNRVYPYSQPNRLSNMNIRTDIHDIIYKALENKNDK